MNARFGTIVIAVILAPAVLLAQRAAGSDPSAVKQNAPTQAQAGAQPATNNTAARPAARPAGGAVHAQAGTPGRGVNMGVVPITPPPAGFGNVNHPGLGVVPVPPGSQRAVIPLAPVVPPTGFGNINHPGLGFVPSQPGAGSGVVGKPPRGQQRRFHPGRTVIVPVPYFVPYYGTYAPAAVDQYGNPVAVDQNGNPTAVDQNGNPTAVDQYGNPIANAPASSGPTYIIVVPQGNAYPGQPYAQGTSAANQAGAAQPQDAPQADSAQSPDNAPNSSVMLAFKDRSIYGATDYWRDGDNLCFTSDFGVQKCVPFEQLDVQLTRRLNPDIKLDFSAAPPPRN